jgi:hypothetical protein
VSAALAAAGAWDATPVESSCNQALNMSLHFTYTRGADPGAFDWQLEVSHYSVVGIVPAGASEWVTMSLYAPGPVAAGADSQSRIQREYATYVAQDAAAEDFVFEVSLKGVIERMRIRARENTVEGTIGAPGNLQITAVLI